MRFYSYVAYAGLTVPSYGSDVFYSSSGVSSVHIISGYGGSSFWGKSVVRDYVVLYSRIPNDPFASMLRHRGGNC